MTLINKLFLSILLFIDYVVNILIRNKYTTRTVVFLFLITALWLNFKYIKKMKSSKRAKKLFFIVLQAFLIIYFIWFIWIHFQMASLKTV